MLWLSPARFILELARSTDREAQLKSFLDRYDLAPEIRTRQIARIFRGVKQEVFVRTAREIPLIPGAIKAVGGLRRR